MNNEDTKIGICPVVLSDRLAALSFFCETSEKRDRFYKGVMKKVEPVLVGKALKFKEKQNLFSDIDSTGVFAENMKYLYSYHFIGDDKEKVYTLLSDDKLFVTEYNERIPLVEILLVAIEGEDDPILSGWESDEYELRD